MTGLHRFMRLARRFGFSQRGVAAVEFALTVPVMLLLYLGSIEASSLFTVDRRITTISSTIGDLVAQAENTITLQEINDYFEAAESILIPYSAVGLEQVITLIHVAPNGSTRVEWSLAAPGGGTPRSRGASYPLPRSSEMNRIARNVRYLVVSETWYSYTPVLGLVIQGPINLYRESFYLPRFGENISEPR